MIKMRKIKYRTWNKEEKKMFYGIERTYDGYEEDSFASYLYSPNKYIVMQFTGLKDKNDKDIFEGDILESNDNLQTKGFVEFGSYHQIGTKENVRYGYHIGCYGLLPMDIKPFNIKVIGNKFETPELIKVEK